MARRAHGRAVPVTGGVDALLEASGEDETRVIALATPTTRPASLLCTAELSRLLEGLPEGVAVLLDESLVEFADSQPSTAHSICWSTIPSCSSSEASPRPGALRDCASAMRSARRLRGAAGELAPDLGVSEVSKQVPWRRCAAARSSWPSACA